MPHIVEAPPVTALPSLAPKTLTTERPTVMEAVVERERPVCGKAKKYP